ncbi:MAG: hypothetical protein J0L73_22320 [Verrucomicrobia bacterium]|nr:hypothetical protein [Verrucomicrobiota bacterium]
MIRLPHSFVLLCLTVLGLASCSGPKGASSKRATPAAAEKPSAATGGAPATADTTPAAAESPPPSDPNASRDAFWNLAMQRYKPPAPASQPALADLPEPARTSIATAVTPTPTVPTPPAASKPATPPQDLKPADIPYATWAPGKRGVVKSPFDPSGRLIDVRDFNAGQMSQCPYTGKIFRVPPLK